MKAFIVSVNGEKLCTAGIGTHGVLMANVTWVGRGGRAQAESPWLHVGGLDPRADEHVCWNRTGLGVGDTVALKVIESETVDAVASRSSNKPDENGLLRAAKALFRGVRGYFARNRTDAGEDQGVTPHPARPGSDLGMATVTGDMTAFAVSVNGEKVCTAGIGPEGVLSCEIFWVGSGPFRSPRGGLRLSVHGLDSRTSEHLGWAVPEVHVGDTVSIEVIETAAVDRETERHGRRAPRPEFIASFSAILQTLSEMLPEEQGRRVDAIAVMVRDTISRRRRGAP